MFQVTPASLLDQGSTLRDKVVFITGGASGFGKRAALYAAEQGAHVVVVDLNARAITQTLKELRALEGECTTPPSATDVTKPESLKVAFEWCITTYGRPADVVIVSAGVAAEDWYEFDDEVAATSSKPAHPRQPRNVTYAVNWEGLLFTCQAAQDTWSSHPISSPSGSDTTRHLVLLASMGGVGGIPGGTIYSMSKHATLGYWEGVCKDLKKKAQKAGFQCHAICPFFADTPILPKATLAVLSGLPLVSVDRVAQAMIYACTRPAEKGPGFIILLPDDQSPLIASVEEYKPLDQEWSSEIAARIVKEDAWRKTAGYGKNFEEFAKRVFKTDSRGLALRLFSGLAILIIALIGFNSIITRLPLWASAATGASLAGLIRLSARSRSSAEKKVR